MQDAGYLIAYIIPYDVFVLLVLFVVVLYSTQSTKGIRKYRNSMILIIVSTSIAMPFQIMTSYDVVAYSAGSNDLLGVHDSIELEPDETHMIQDISNWYNIEAFTIDIITLPENVTFYLKDENSPEVRYHELELGNTSIGLRLPHLYSEFLKVANWTLCFTNPNEMSIHISYGVVFLIPLVSTPSVHTYYALQAPLIALSLLWILIPSLLYIHKEVSKEIILQQRRLSITAVGLVALYLIVSSPILLVFSLVQIFPIILLCVLIGLIGHSRLKK